MTGFSSLKVETETANMKQMPYDVLFTILSRLPVKSLFRFKCVSKDWRALIQDPAFVDFHLEQGKNGSAKTLYTVCMSNVGDSKILLVSYKIKIDCSIATPSEIMEDLDDNLNAHHCDSTIASCDGLFCFSRNGVVIVVYNPATGETLEFPVWNFGSAKKFTDRVGIGFDSVRKEYKAVCWNTESDTEVQIIAFGADSWRKIEGPSKGRDQYGSSRGSVYLNGASHWCTAAGILSFDFTEEKFSNIALPTDMLPAHDHGCQISELEGQIVLVDKRMNDTTLKMWTLTDCQETEWVSTEIHMPMIENGKLLRVVSIRKGEILVELDLVRCGRVCICRYNDDGQVTDFIHVTGIPYFLGVPYEHQCHALYVESLVSFKQYNARGENA